MNLDWMKKKDAVKNKKKKNNKDEKKTKVTALIAASEAEEDEYKKADGWLKKEVRIREERIMLHLQKSAELAWDAFLEVMAGEPYRIQVKRPDNFGKQSLEQRRSYIFNKEMSLVCRELKKKELNEPRRMVGEFCILLGSKVFFDNVESGAETFTWILPPFRKKVMRLARNGKKEDDKEEKCKRQVTN